MASKEELACVYSALILQDDEVAITGEKIQTILKAANVDVEPFWPSLFAKALDGTDVKGLISNISSGVGSAAPAVAAAPVGGAAPAAEKKEEKKESKKEEKKEEEEDEDMGFGLFD